MSTTALTGSLGTGAQIAVRAIQSAGADFEKASRSMQSQLAAASNQSGSTTGQGNSTEARLDEQIAPTSLVTPPNPGPPGGAQPADLAEAMAQQELSVHRISANVKTLQAFDEMLGEVLRIAADKASKDAAES